MYGQVYFWGAIIVVAFVVIALVARAPWQVAWKLARSAIVGCVFVFVVDSVGHFFHYHLPFNPFTAMTAGFLGIPGIAALITLQLWQFPS